MESNALSAIGSINTRQGPCCVATPLSLRIFWIVIDDTCRSSNDGDPLPLIVVGGKVVLDRRGCGCMRGNRFSGGVIVGMRK